MLLVEMSLAAARIDNQAERQRDIRAAGEKRDVLRGGLFEYFEIVFGQAAGQGAMRVAHGEREVDQIDIHLDARLLLGGAEVNKSEESQQRTHHPTDDCRPPTEDYRPRGAAGTESSREDSTQNFPAGVLRRSIPGKIDVACKGSG